MNDGTCNYPPLDVYCAGRPKGIHPTIRKAPAMKHIRLFLVLLGLTTGSLACSSFGTLNDHTDTVDKAVSLLQDIEDRGTWQFVTDGLESLHEEDQGYEAIFSARQEDAENNPADALDLTLKTDSNGGAVIEVMSGGTASHYLVLPGTTPNEPPTVYRYDGDRFVPADNDEPSRIDR